MASAAAGGEAYAEHGIASAWLLGDAQADGGAIYAGLAGAYATFGGTATASHDSVSCSGIAYAVAQDGTSCLSISPFQLIAKRILGL